MALEAILRRTQGKEGPVRFYECSCHGWHHTKQPLDDPSEGVIKIR